MLHLNSPVPLQVLQRSTTGPDLGSGQLTVTGTGASADADTAEVRTVALSESFGTGTPWVSGAFTRTSGDGGYVVEAAVGAGGWFRVDVRLTSSGRLVGEASVEPVGIGEVFVVAGQSYAAVCHEQVLTVTDPLGRVTASCPEVGGWRIAHDPQPKISNRVDPQTSAELQKMLAGLDLSFPHGPHSPFLGSIWPAVGDALVEGLGVPVGFVHAAVGGTRIAHWQRGTMLFDNICDAVRLAGDYRALLWQQGESDAGAGTPTKTYRAALRALRDDVVGATSLDRAWLAAKSTYHPTSERPFEDGEDIRAAIDALWHEPGFAPGPDTDMLQGIGDHRAPFSRGGHFTGKGQRAAAALWAQAILNTTPPPPTR